MQTISADEFKKKYGEAGHSVLIKPNEQPSYLERVSGGIKNDAINRDVRLREIIQRPDTSPLERGLQFVGQGAGAAANLIETPLVEAPGVKQALGAVGSGVNWLATSEYSPVKHLGDLFGKSETLQEAVQLYDSDKNFKDTVDAVGNAARLGADVSAIVDGTTYLKNVTEKLTTKLSSAAGTKTGTIDNAIGEISTSGHDYDAVIKSGDIPKEMVFKPDGSLQPSIVDHVVSDIAGKLDHFKKGLGTKFKTSVDISNATPESLVQQGIDFAKESVKPSVSIGDLIPRAGKVVAKGIGKDLLPGAERLINSEITQALDLKPSDVQNISLSTGNDVGEFIANKNLIGGSVAETQKNIDSFYKSNYSQVRTEIGKVKDTYKQSQVPRYVDALKQIQQKVTGVSGLEKVAVEVENLLNKQILNLNDVQRAKELIDEHFKLYSATGDVGQGVAKEGLVNIRKELRGFIETKVKNATGVDIKPLNNNVQTSRAVLDAVKARSTRGLTKANISPSDILTFLAGSAFGTPLTGAAALIVKKIYQSPTFKLKFVKWLDGKTDAERARIQSSFEEGKVPKDIPPDLQALYLPEKNRLETSTKTEITKNPQKNTSLANRQIIT